MSNAVSDGFVQSVAAEFFRRYECPVSRDESDGELWLECCHPTPERFRSLLTFGIAASSVTVAFDGLVRPFIIHPDRDGAATRVLAFGLFDDLINERQVAISFWRGDECIAVEFISPAQVRDRQGAWADLGASRVRVRSWLGKYDYDSAA